MSVSYRFSFGPWNLSEGGDPFGPPVRESFTFAEKLSIAQQLGFDAMQFHDDDAVPNLDSLTPSQMTARARHQTDARGSWPGGGVRSPASMGESPDD
jgi:xylose isomerase